MFYLQSRGIRQQEARHMILYARLPQVNRAIRDIGAPSKQQRCWRDRSATAGAIMTFPVEKVRADFPILQRVKLTACRWLWTAQPALKSNQVIDADRIYRHGYAAGTSGIPYVKRAGDRKHGECA